jgi:hypothetical protein
MSPPTTAASAPPAQRLVTLSNSGRKRRTRNNDVTPEVCIPARAALARSTEAADPEGGGKLAALTHDEEERYTYGVLRRKGWRVDYGVTPEGLPTYTLHAPGATEEEGREFYTEEDLLGYARGEGALVSVEELREHAEGDPWRPHIRAMRAVAARDGPLEYADVRVEERRRLRGFLHRCVTEPHGGLVYLSGLPGTGKTATVYQCWAELEAELEGALGEAAAPTMLYVNGANLSERPVEVLARLSEKLGLITTERDERGRELTRQEFVEQLEPRLRAKKHAAPALSQLLSPSGPSRAAREQAVAAVSGMVVLVLDEVDRFVHSQQGVDVARDLARMALGPRGGLILVAISNLIGDDVPRNMRPSDPSMRPNEPFISFPTYTAKELVEIMSVASDGLVQVRAYT